MEIKELNIKNYKSIKEISIKKPNSFSVFVGPNAAGKSNIFEALEFYISYSGNLGTDLIRRFGDIKNYKIEGEDASTLFFEVNFENIKSYIRLNLWEDSQSAAKFQNFFSKEIIENFAILESVEYWKEKDYKQFFTDFSRIFVGNEKIQKFAFDDDKRLSLSCGNLEQVLKRILQNEEKKEEIIEWLRLLIPGFESVEIKTEELSESNNLLIYEKGIQKPLTKKIISDGTYNIIAILTALYQSDEPQFLCIEEPENGLNPKVVRELVKLFRQQCKEKGHFIWLNTHSQSIVSELTTEEIILVDKIEGETKIKQIQGMDLHGLKMDEALLTNAIGGGIPW